MTRKLDITYQEARRYLRIAKAGPGIVEVEMGGLIYRFIPAQFANLDRPSTRVPVDKLRNRKAD